MTTDLPALAREALEISSKATPEKYWKNLGKGQCYGLWYRHFMEGPHTDGEQAKRDATWAEFARTALPRLAQAYLDAEASKRRCLAIAKDSEDALEVAQELIDEARAKLKIATEALKRVAVQCDEKKSQGSNYALFARIYTTASKALEAIDK